MTQLRIPAVYMRGGTSKGVFFRADVLPVDPLIRNALLLRVIGSPDPYGKHIDGMGGATSSTGLISQPVLIKQGLSRDRVIVTHAMQMAVLHGLKVAAFVIVGFSFFQYWEITVAMLVASVGGSYCGGFLRKKVPEQWGVALLKGGITFFALKMIWDAFQPG